MLDVLAKDITSPVHESGALHVQGRAEYVDDRPPEARELLVGLVYSPHARARIRAVDTTKIKQIKEYVRVFDVSYVHHNRWGSIIHDQPLLADDEVFYVGEVILIVAAETQDVLQKALGLIRIDYEVLPAILSIEQAVAQQSFIGGEKQIERGAWKADLLAAPHRLTGSLEIEGADHFYLENQAAIVYPRDGGIIEVHSSTQHPSETQHLVADALGLPLCDVVCQATRLGGAFGGKESQAAPFAVYAAIVAFNTQRPARITLTKDDDMIITGKRNPFQVHYEIGFTNRGEILAIKALLYGNGGAYADLSTAILERALCHVDNAYFLPSASIRGQVCRTHQHPHTAFRGFGGPKGVALIEHAIEAIAHYLKIDAFDVRLTNCYQGPARNLTPYGQVVENDRLLPLMQDLARRCEYRQRRAALSAEQNQHFLRGMALTPVKFGISFITRFLNQGNALVHIHQDGSLQVSTGAVEMGQGVHTRIAGIIAREFAIPITSIRVMPTRTDKNANTSATAASSGTDINGSAAMIACGPLKERLARMFLALIDCDPKDWPSKTIGLGLRDDMDLRAFAPEAVGFAEGKIFLHQKPVRSLPFATVVKEAYYNRVSLSEYGFYKTGGLDFNKVVGQGRAFQYFSEGAACSEVEVNRLTGEVKVLRTDILMDLGRPVNLALDIGQVRGAFVQGMGWVTTEQLVYSDKGKLLSHAPSTYKIPSVHDTPRIFNVELLNSIENKTLHRGRAVGEPPLLLCFSVWAAIMDALKYATPKGPFPSLAIPASRERVLRHLYPEEFARWEGTPS